MSKISKSNLTVDGNSVHVSMPFAKVDKANRLVSGWATLDNIDTEGDVVLAEASAKAFSRARGNIREMHQPLAVGRMVDFKEDEHFDTETGEIYRGIYVTARVSEGAESTWLKVLDGTLTGFSIGGEIRDASNEFIKEAGRTVRFIKDYDLVELSLVDNPANQLANINSLQKSILTIGHADNGEIVMKGMAVETKIENVFACEKHEEPFFSVSAEESASCPVCENNMTNIGWFESGADRTEKVSGIVNKFRNPVETEATPSSESEGGVDMSNVTKSAKEVSSPNPAEAREAGDEDAVATVEEEAEQATDVEEVEDDEETAESPDEVEDEQTEISKKIDALHDAVKTSLAESHEETLAKVSELETKVESAKEAFLAKATELEDKINEFGNKVETQKNKLSELESSLEKMNSSDAFKKSADVHAAVPVVQKETFWGGAFSDH